MTSERISLIQTTFGV